MSRELDRQVCQALGWNDDDFAKAHNRLPKFSTEPGFVGTLLLEAQKRGWPIDIHLTADGNWFACFGRNKLSQSLPEAVCQAFVAAAKETT